MAKRSKFKVASSGHNDPARDILHALELAGEPLTPNELAKRLRIHPNTLRYRLDRVREVSGAELEDPETRLNLAVALRVQALLGLLAEDEARA